MNNTKTHHILLVAFAIVFQLLLHSCNRDGEVNHLTSVSVVGYNNTGETLKIEVDTVNYNKTFDNNWMLTFKQAYLYKPGSDTKLQVKGESGKIYWETSLQKGALRQNFGLTLVNGTNTYNPPKALAPNNKVGFFLADPYISTPIDIVLVAIKRDNNYQITAEERIILVKNLEPWQWAYVDYIPKGLLADKNQFTANIHLYKAGTTEWAFDARTSNSNSNSNKSVDLEKGAFGRMTKKGGAVYSYVIAVERPYPHITQVQFSHIEDATDPINFTQ